MPFGGSEPTKGITISSSNPYDGSDTPRYVESNQSSGIVFLGPATSQWPIPTQGVQLDDVLVRNNAGYGVVLDTTSNLVDSSTGTTIYYYGFINNSCMSGNSFSNVAQVPNTLSYPYPNSYTTYRGGNCPNPGWASQTPAHSNRPGWPW